MDIRELKIYLDDLSAKRRNNPDATNEEIDKAEEQFASDFGLYPEFMPIWNNQRYGLFTTDLPANAE